MQKREYLKLLNASRDDLERLFREREHLERRIARQRETVISLGLMYEHDPKFSEGFYLPENLTQACLNAIVAAKAPLEAIDIRRHVERMGFDIASSNPLASVHSVLKRLVEQREVRVVRRANSDGSFQMPPYYWYGRDELPNGWGDPSPEQIQKQMSESWETVTEMRNKDIKRVDAKAAKQTKALLARKRGRRNKG